MDRRARLAGVLLVGLGWLLAGLGGVAGGFAAAGAGPGFLVTPVEGTLARTMPGPIVSFAILVLGSLGQQLNLVFAIGLSGALLGGAGAVGGYAGAGLAHVARRRVGGASGRVQGGEGRSLPAITGAGVAPWVLSALVTGYPIEAAGAGLGVVLVVVAAGLTPRLGADAPAKLADMVDGPAGNTAGDSTGDSTRDSTRDTAEDPAEDGTDDAGRRAIVRAFGTALGVTAIGLPLGVLRGQRSAQPTASDDESGSKYDVEAQLSAAREQSLSVRGLEPLVSDEFYQVDINAVDPTIEPEEYELSVEGAVGSPFTTTLADLQADFSVEHRFATLRCVGENLNGKKMDTAVWTGVPVDAILERVEPQAESVVLRAEDGYFVGFPLEALRGGLLAYGMNGQGLPRGHGAPLRALVPGHWGEVNTKWLTTMEFVDEPVTGYWERRGWHGTGPVNTVAKLHAIDRAAGRITVGGHAYAGTRGIDRVEVSTDGGRSWVDATLSAPLPGEDVWRQWSHTYESPGERHEVVVRATDGTGTRQPKARTDAFPSGPTGWVSKRIRG